MKTILTRRSIRKYTKQSVSDDLIKQILEAAMAAPSAGNGQPWQFIVIKERKILDEIPNVHPSPGKKPTWRPALPGRVEIDIGKAGRAACAPELANR